MPCRPTKALAPIPDPAEVRISVYDMQGRLLARPVDEQRPAGTHAATWDPRSRGVGPGLYFVRFEALGHRVTGRLAFIR